MEVDMSYLTSQYKPTSALRIAHFPWTTCFHQYPRQKSDTKVVEKIVQLFKGNPYVSYTLSGTGLAFSIIDINWSHLFRKIQKSWIRRLHITNSVQQEADERIYSKKSSIRLSATK